MTPRVLRYATEAAIAHDTTLRDVMSRSQRRAPVAARREAWSRLRTDGFHTTQIGRWFDRKHSTVVIGLQRARLPE